MIILVTQVSVPNLIIDLAVKYISIKYLQASTTTDSAGIPPAGPVKFFCVWEVEAWAIWVQVLCRYVIDKLTLYCNKYKMRSQMQVATHQCHRLYNKSGSYLIFEAQSLRKVKVTQSHVHNELCHTSKCSNLIITWHILI